MSLRRPGSLVLFTSCLLALLAFSGMADHVAGRLWASTYSVTGPADATIAQLGLSEREIHDIRSGHFLANLSEDTWFKTVILTAWL